MKKYQSYKDSGMEWIGEIPSHWVKGKWRFYFKSGMGQTILKEDLVDNGEVKVFSATEEDVIFGYVNAPKLILSDGDIVIPARGNSIGHVKLVKGISTTTQTTIYSKRMSNKIDSSYIYYYCKGNKTNLFPFVQTAIPQITVDEINSNAVLLPPLNEQQQIVSYLDQKTQQIDDLIQNKEKKIELLKEKRTSLINHVVTKGLNPNSEMKDSGVEWIGEIPIHWDFLKLKQLFNIQKRISGELGYDVLSVTQRGLKVKDLDDNQGQHSMDYSKYQLVFEGDFVMNHMDLLTGFVDLSEQTGVTSPDYRVFTKVNDDIINEYYLYIFQLCYWRKIFYGLGRGVSNMGRWRLPSIEFLNFYLPFPSGHEQQQIVKYLDEQTDLIDKSVSTERKKIKYLKEYRQSLISEVVTGKIRVCEEDHSAELKNEMA